MPDLTLTANGVPLAALGPVGDIAYETLWGPGGGGLSKVTWSMQLPKRFSHPAFRLGAKVVLKYGPLPLGQAVLSEPNFDDWTFEATGLAPRASRFYAVDSTGAPTTKPSIAVAQQQANLGWLTGSALPATTVAALDISSGPVKIADVLDGYCAATNQRWWLDGAGALYLGTDPASPRWSLVPGTPSLESADDDFATTLRVKYATAVDANGSPTGTAYTSSTNARAAAQWGAAEDFQDITAAGALTAAQAQANAAAILATESPRPGFTSSIQVAVGVLANLGGRSAADAWWMVKAGQKVRHHNWRNLSGSLAPGQYLDWVIGQTSYSKDQGLTITPIGLAPRDTQNVIAAITAAATAAS